MSALSTREKKQIKDLIIALNSTNDLGFKYPIGNAKLLATVKELDKIDGCCGIGIKIEEEIKKMEF